MQQIKVLMGRHQYVFSTSTHTPLYGLQLVDDKPLGDRIDDTSCRSRKQAIIINLDAWGFIAFVDSDWVLYVIVGSNAHNVFCEHFWICVNNPRFQMIKMQLHYG
jgi:hypothetical protein